MSLRPVRRSATATERWAVRLGVGFAAFGVVFFAWAVSDIDGDGLASIDELRMGTNPIDGDTDGDGASDGWEISQTGDRHAADDGVVPCGLLNPCDPAQPESAPPAPTVSAPQATALTVGIAVFAGVAGIVAGAWAGRRLR